MEQIMAVAEAGDVEAAASGCPARTAGGTGDDDGDAATTATVAVAAETAGAARAKGRSVPGRNGGRVGERGVGLVGGRVGGRFGGRAEEAADETTDETTESRSSPRRTRVDPRGGEIPPRDGSNRPNPPTAHRAFVDTVARLGRPSCRPRGGRLRAPALSRESDLHARISRAPPALAPRHPLHHARKSASRPASRFALVFSSTTSPSRVHALVSDERFDTLASERRAVSRPRATAPRERAARRVARVDVPRPDVQTPQDVRPHLRVRRVHARGESERRVRHRLHRLFVVFDHHQRDDGSERFVAGQRSIARCDPRSASPPITVTG